MGRETKGRGWAGIRGRMSAWRGGLWLLACILVLGLADGASRGDGGDPTCEEDPCQAKCDPCKCCETYDPCACGTDMPDEACDSCPVWEPCECKDIPAPMCPAPQGDTDGDRIPDECDNCLEIQNPGQEDADADGVGDLCDNCKFVPNPGQEDHNSDGIGDACQCDWSEYAPHSPYDLNQDRAVNMDDFAILQQCLSGSGYAPSATCQAADFDCDNDVDGTDINLFKTCMGSDNPHCGEGCVCDGLTEACDTAHGYPRLPDTDHDNVPDDCDNCAPGSLVYQCPQGDCANESQLDSDGDRIGDHCDNCPYVNNPGQEDQDQDGIGDACDTCTPSNPLHHCDRPGVNCASVNQTDSDGDGVGDVCDNCTPNNPLHHCAGTNCANPDQSDSDNDGIGDACDNCPQAANSGQEDSDSDGVGDACDVCPGGNDKADADGDGVPDACDICDKGRDQDDADGDGIPDACDDCPNLGNTVPDCDGDCVSDAAAIATGLSLDTDGNGIPDECPGNKMYALRNAGYPVDAGVPLTWPTSGPVDKMPTVLLESATPGMPEELLYWIGTPCPRTPEVPGKFLAMARSNGVTGTWDIWTGNDTKWDWSPQALAEPMTPPTFWDSECKVFPNPSDPTAFFGVALGNLYAGPTRLNEHGGVYGLSMHTDNEGVAVRRWIPPAAWDEYAGVPILKSYKAAGYDFAFDGEDTAILIKGACTSTDCDLRRALIAARYRLSEDSWHEWKNNDWVSVTWNTGDVISDLHPDPPKEPTDVNLPNPGLGGDELRSDPVVTHIAGTSDFLVTFIHQVGIGAQTVKTLTAMLYNHYFEPAPWFWWEGNGAVQPWHSRLSEGEAYVPGSFVNFLDAAHPIPSSSYPPAYRPTVSRQGESGWASEVCMFHADSGRIYRTSFFHWDCGDHGSLGASATEQVLTVPGATADDSRFYVVGMDAQNVIWLAFVDGNAIKLTKERGPGAWMPPVTIYQSATPVQLRALTFVDGGTTPVVFFLRQEPTDSSEGRLYCLSWADGQVGGGNSVHWSGEVAVQRNPGEAVPPEPDPDLQWVGQWCRPVADQHPEWYGIATGTAHLELDAEGWLYAPNVELERVMIYSPAYKSQLAAYDPNAPVHLWNDGWDIFTCPGAVAVDNTRGFVYITDRLGAGGGRGPNYYGQIQRWHKTKRTESVTDGRSPNGYLLGRPDELDRRTRFEQPPFLPTWYWPSDVAVDEGAAFLYVAESMRNRIMRYSIARPAFGLENALQIDSVLTGGGSGTDTFKFPQGIDVDEEGCLYIVDSGNHRVVKCQRNAQDQYVQVWKTQPGQFRWPYAISVDDADDVVYVTEWQNCRVQVFDKQGNFLRSWGSWTPDSNDVAYQGECGTCPADSFVGGVTGIAARGKDLYVGVRRPVASDCGCSHSAHECRNEIVRFLVRPSTIVGRHVFYNNSAWDGNDPSATAADDAAIATDKVPLIPGGAANTTNYISYSRGLNGIMIDVQGLRGTPVVGDFEFLRGNDESPASWTPAPAPLSITVRPGAGDNDSDRVTLVWADNAIPNSTWLRVQVKPTDHIRLAKDDVFYFGLAIGESLTPDGAYAVVTDTDVTEPGEHLTNPATITNAYDYNRDGAVTLLDGVMASDHQTTATNALRLIPVPQE